MASRVLRAVALAAILFFLIGVSMAPAQIAPPDLNAMLSQFMGRKVNLAYGAGGKQVTPGELIAHGGMTNQKTGRVYIPRDMYGTVRGFDTLGRAPVTGRQLSALALLSHELGHVATPVYTGTPNGTGGVDFNQAIPEHAADVWGETHARGLLRAMGVNPHFASVLAPKVAKAIRVYRKQNPY
jgi:hypothetical protein